jgi:hypothetical protein
MDVNKRTQQKRAYTPKPKCSEASALFVLCRDLADSCPVTTAVTENAASADQFCGS